MDDIDALVRGAAIGVILVSTSVLLRTWPNRSFARIGALYAAGAICHLLWGHPVVATWLPLARLWIAIFALSAPFFFWTLARLIFEDGFALRPAHWMLLAVVVMAGIAQGVVSGYDWPWLSRGLRIGFRLISLALIFHVFWLVWKGRSVDLVEKRARLRLVFLVGTGVATALIVLTALLYSPAPDWPAPGRLIEAAVLLLLNAGFAIYFMHVDRDLLPAQTAPAASPPLSMNSRAPRFLAEAGAGLDADLLTRLEKLMRHREVWRETGLTIGDLAARAATPEHRLRRLINQRLGFRNFTAFLNEYRLSAAAVRLADRDHIHVPVLTIALELGWGSIGPFNRAFRTRFGMTPTDYRREQAMSPELSA